MATHYKTDAATARQMATAWYRLAGVAAPTPRALDWWTKQIQQDGSHTAFLNFQTGKGQDQADAFDPQVLQQNSAKFKATANIDPWQPDAQTGQLAGTNTKNLSGIANQHPVLAAIYGGELGGLGGSMTSAGIYSAAHPGGTGLDYERGVLKAAAVPAAASAGGLLGNALGIGGAASGAAGAASDIPDAATMAPGDLAAAANAGTGGGSGGGFLSGLFGSGNGIGGSGLSVTDLLKGVGSGIGAYTNQANTAAALAERKREFDAQNALNTQNVATNEGQTAVQAQNRLNTAPLADQSQYMLKHLMSTPPAAFQPRDYTQAGGSNNTLAPATGGAAQQLAANQAAASNYTPGAGGVDTSTLKLLLDKLKGSGSAFGNMPTTSSTATG